MRLFNQVSDKQINETLINSQPILRERPVIQKLKIEPSIETEISPLTQYFLLPFIISNADGILHIPVYDELTDKQVISDVAPHFKNCKVVNYQKNSQYMLSELNIRSKNQMIDLITKDAINSIAYELHQSNKEFRAGVETEQYSINLNLISKIQDQNMNDMWEFFQRSHIRENGEMTFIPKNWVMNNDLKENLAIRSLANVCSSIRITIVVNSKEILSVNCN